MVRLIALVGAIFAKVGLFTLGGGLAIIALVQQETLSRGWLSQPEFLDILAVAQVTPGPMGVNAATFTGWRTVVNAGGGAAWAFAGALAATIAVMLASVVGVAFAGTWFSKNHDKPLVKTSCLRFSARKAKQAQSASTMSPSCASSCCPWPCASALSF